jgi:hypothetical protein
MHSDYNSQIDHTEGEISTDSIRAAWPDREELILAWARVCALSAIEQGSPAIKEGTTYGDWSSARDAQIGDYESLDEVLCDQAGRSATGASDEEKALFREAFLTNLFEESECECEDEDADAGRGLSAEAAGRIGEEDGRDAADTFWRETLRDARADRAPDPEGIAIEALRLTQTQSGCGWTEGAMNAGSASIRDIKTDEARAIYYATYERAARERAQEILDEHSSEE